MHITKGTLLTLATCMFTLAIAIPASRGMAAADLVVTGNDKIIAANPINPEV